MHIHRQVNAGRVVSYILNSIFTYIEQARNNLNRPLQKVANSCLGQFVVAAKELTTK